MSIRYEGDEEAIFTQSDLDAARVEGADEIRKQWHQWEENTGHQEGCCEKVLLAFPRPDEAGRPAHRATNGTVQMSESKPGRGSL